MLRHLSQSKLNFRKKIKIKIIKKFKIKGGQTWG